MRNAKYGMRSTECEVRNEKYGMRSANHEIQTTLPVKTRWLDWVHLYSVSFTAKSAP